MKNLDSLPILTEKITFDGAIYTPICLVVPSVEIFYKVQEKPRGIFYGNIIFSMDCIHDATRQGLPNIKITKEYFLDTKYSSTEPNIYPNIASLMADSFVKKSPGYLYSAEDMKRLFGETLDGCVSKIKSTYAHLNTDSVKKKQSR